MITKKKIVRSKNIITITESPTRNVTGKRPSWKKLKLKLKRGCEADGEFQDGEYTDDSTIPDYEPILEED